MLLERMGLGGGMEACFQPNKSAGRESMLVDTSSTGGGAWCVRFATEAAATGCLALNGAEIYPGGGRAVDVQRTSVKHMGVEEQPSKVFMTHVPLDATDADVAAFALGRDPDPAHDGTPASSFTGVHVFRIKARPGNHRGLEEGAFSGACVVALPSAGAATQCVAACNGRPMATAAGSTGYVAVATSQRRVWEGVSSGGAGGGGGGIRGGARGGHGGRGGDAAASAVPARPEGCLTAWVGGLPRECDEEQCRAVLAHCGPMTSFRFIRDASDGECRGFAFATFQAPRGVEAAVATLHGAKRLGTTLKVRYETEKPKRGGRH